MLEPEVNPVIAALRKNNLKVVAVHSHMIGEDPRIIFLHYYGTGPAATLTSRQRPGCARPWRTKWRDSASCHDGAAPEVISRLPYWTGHRLTVRAVSPNRT